jgi:hypothetical protein
MVCYGFKPNFAWILCGIWLYHERLFQQRFFISRLENPYIHNLVCLESDKFI